jgi:hypothetical protein
MALKTGRLGEAAEAADKAIKSLASVPSQAASWFNMGLICEQLANGIEYNGSYYCYGDHLEPFMRSWQLRSSPGEARKLVDYLQKNDSDVCMVANRRYKFVFNPGINSGDRAKGERIYVLHRADEYIDPKSIQLTVSGTMETVTQMPRAVGRLVLDQQAVTLLEADYFAKSWLVDGKPCLRN